MIKLGPAGNCDKGILKSIVRLHDELQLDAQEVPFTYGVNMGIELAEEAGKLAREKGISVSVHAPYYVNLLSEDKSKVVASKQRILLAAERGHYLGATHIVFHAGFYGKLSKEDAYEIVKKEVADLQKSMKKNKWESKIAPETTGKQSQFGDLDELLRLSKETGCSFCIDFAHMKARTNGKMSYAEMIEKIRGKGHIHAHFSGIMYGAKGERNHEVTPKPEIMELMKAIVKAGLDITIINESPITWRDSLKMKDVLERLK